VNKSFVTNLIAASITLVGYFYASMLLMSIGLFALSGALTNWIAVHMLFEKIPGFYGSGVVPARFEEFKAAIRVLMMEQFFTAENIQRFLSADGSGAKTLDLEPVIDATDLSPAFDGLVSVIEGSSFGSMLTMVGGSAALQPLKEPFTARLKESLIEISSTDEFNQMLSRATVHAGNDPEIRDKIASVIEKRLDELTPQLVKEIVQAMIKKHLGWLVVWGGVFGGLIGLVAGYFNPLAI
jgi:uncharacterized membrane-anchored protein YjiN (DUF445 family)